ncbi:MAG TPA: hypothetical protein VGB79_16390 [Allosphingosinicella sp.]
MRRATMMMMLAAAALLPTAAEAGIRARYSERFGPPRMIEIADNGDFSADLGSGVRLVAVSGEEYLVRERLTGPIVTRLADFAALPPRGTSDPSPPPGAERFALIERGTAEVNGRTGRAVYPPDFGANAAPGDKEPFLVISDDPALAPLGPVMARALEAELLMTRIEHGGASETGSNPLGALLQRGAPLRFGESNLGTVELRPIPPGTIALPAAPETPAALRERIAAERGEETQRSGPRIVRAAYGAGRLWLLEDDDARLTSLAEGESVRRAERPGGSVVDLCASGDEVLAVTGRADGGRAWTLHRYDGGRWARIRSIPRAGDHLIALTCGAGGTALLTSRRLVPLNAAQAPDLALSEPLRVPLVSSVVHLTPAAAFVGLNLGEWGGGMRRIDRASGRVETIERNATGGLCDGPLNTGCDPVNAIVTLRSRPDCIAAAIGLTHLLAHGRIVRVCGREVEQMAVGLAEADPDDPRRFAEARLGGYGAAAFYGLIPAADGYLAAAHNGLYRIGENGSAAHESWPLFRWVDGVLVSFVLPEAVLVVTDVNRRAAMSGATPLLVAR